MSRTLILCLLILLSTPFAISKDKSKTLPAQVLRAETIFVVIDPDAGEPLTDPTANSTARGDVEKALMQWGRFHLVMDAFNADLVLSVRKGTARSATPTMKGGPIDNRPVIIQPNGDDQIRVGAQHGKPPAVSQRQELPNPPRVETEVGPSEDMVALYLGRVDYPLDHPSIWRYHAKDALHPPRVQAIDALRKIFLETEKAEQQRKSP